MFLTCPKCNYERQPADGAPSGQCPACGLVFAKYLARQIQIEDGAEQLSRGGSNAEGAAAGAGARAGREGGTPAGDSLVRRILAAPLHIEDRVDPVVYWARVLTLVGLGVWGVYFISLDHTAISGGSVPIGESFLHRINLVFHEAGHVLFIPFGRFMTVLGGSLFQVLMPLIVAGTFVFKYRNPFGASVALWWAGQSLMDVAPYIYDAQHNKLILLGGITGADAPGSHDWKYLLAITGKTHRADSIAAFVDALGALLLLSALAWGAYLLIAQFSRIDRRF